MSRQKLSSHRRGYGRAHRARRAHLAPLVAAGVLDCARCGKRIEPGEPFDLGHLDGEKTRYSGVVHSHCNRRAGAIAGNAKRTRLTSRQWCFCDRPLARRPPHGLSSP